MPAAVIPLGTLISSALGGGLAGMAIAFAFGFLLGGAALYVWSYAKWNVGRLTTNLLRGDALGVVYDVETEQIDLVPLYRLGPNTYASKDPLNPVIAIKPAEAQPAYLKLHNRPVYFVLNKQLGGVCVSPETLYKVGVASLAINDVKWDTKNPASVEDLLVTLFSMKGEVTREIRVNPDLKLGVTVRMHDAIKAITSFLGSLSVAAMQGVNDSIQVSQELAKAIRELRARKEAGWGNVIIMALMIVGVIALATLVLLPKILPLLKP